MAKAIPEITEIHLPAFLADRLQISAQFPQRASHQDRRVETADRLLDAPIGITDEIGQRVDHHPGETGRDSNFEARLLGIDLGREIE
jgi:hypothetical protein